MKPFNRHYCKHKGCPASYIAEVYLQKHEAKPHFLCTCGRFFTLHGKSIHLAQVRIRNIKHP